MRILLLFLLSTFVLAQDLEPTEWLDLLPPADLQALEQMSEIEHEGVEGEGDFTKNLRNNNKKLPAAMFSDKTVDKFNGKEIKIGGYPVPLELNEDGQATALFLVPYAGACIHVPAPPPNQIIYVKYDKAIRISDIFRPIWVYGKLEIKKESNSLADSAYSINADKILWVKNTDW